jgi:tRNA (guanine-N1)-methyltransferase
MATLFGSPMKFDVITLFPEALQDYCSISIVGRAFKEQKAELHLHQLREHGIGKYRKVDDIPYGGGAGMVLKPEPIFAAHRQIIKQKNCKTLLLTPRGKTLNQAFIRNELLPQEQLIIICGHYEGFDERVMTLVDHQVSLGNYVLTGGELGALIIIDAVTRLLPGVLAKGQEAHGKDSFSDLEAIELEAPQYTRPADFEGMKVPEVLQNGNHAEIKKWRQQHAKPSN